MPTSTRSAVTSSPVSRLKETHGFGMRPKTNFWIGWPVAVFIIVAVTPIAALIAAAMGVSSGMRRVSVAAAIGLGLVAMWVVWLDNRAKAEALGVQVIDEAQWLEMIAASA